MMQFLDNGISLTIAFVGLVVLIVAIGQARR
jgi:hypothetical protein